MSVKKLLRLAFEFEKLSEQLYVTPFREVAKKFHSVMRKLEQSQSDDDNGLVESVGPVKEINPSQFQFQSAVWRDLEEEMNGDKFSGLTKLVQELSKHLGRPKEKGKHSVVWETIQPNIADSIRISIVAYDSGSAETHALKITVGPLRSDLL